MMENILPLSIATTEPYLVSVNYCITFDSARVSPFLYWLITARWTSGEQRRQSSSHSCQGSSHEAYRHEAED